MTNELENPRTELRDKVERAGLCFVTQAGFHPGIIAPLVRHAGQQLDVMDSAIVAGFNWFADYFVTPLIMLGSRIAPRQTEAPLGRLLSWSTEKFSRPPYGTVVQVDAKGQRDSRPVSIRYSLFHEDAYVLTAVPTVAMIKQMLNGKVQPGIHLMGLCCDPVQLLEDIERAGVSITRQHSPIAGRAA